jgi:DNA-binding response OmpR family regulator
VLPKVLVVADGPGAAALVAGLRSDGFDVVGPVDVGAALDAVEGAQPDVVVLDTGRTGLDGAAATRCIRADGCDVPVCVLSARTEVHDRVAALQAGADDCLVKPFAPVELVARLHALLRRRSPARVPLQAGDLRVDPARRIARRGDRCLDLTRREFELLAVLVAHPGIVLSRAQLLAMVWGYDRDVDSNVVDVFVGYLRRKLEVAGEPRVLHTVRGVGFVLRP